MAPDCCDYVIEQSMTSARPNFGEPQLSQLSVVTNGDPMRRFEELCDLIAIEQDVANFSALVTELNQLDPARRLPVVSKQPPPSRTVQN